MVRLVTVHPALVHLPIGLAPIAALAYLVAVTRRSRLRAARWTFAGDFALVAAALFALAAAAFGLVSSDLLDWSGGLDRWRWIHLGGGVASAALLASLAVLRLARRRRPVGRGFLAASLGTLAVLLFTGWVGGEVLVYYAGMAVRGGALGTLSPPLEKPGTPSGFKDAMGRMRGELSAVTAEAQRMVVEHPRDATFNAAAGHAAALEQVADWLGEHPESFEKIERKHERGRGRPPEVALVGGHDEATDPEVEIANYAVILGDGARELLAAARSHDLMGLSLAAGRLRAGCAGCHESVRWRP